MKYFSRKILIVAFVCHGFQVQAQEENDFAGDWSVVGAVVLEGITSGPRTIETDDWKLVLKINDDLVVEAYASIELFDFGYLNDFYLVSEAAESTFLKGKVTIKSDTLTLKNRTGCICPTVDYRIYFKKID